MVTTTRVGETVVWGFAVVLGSSLLLVVDVMEDTCCDDEETELVVGCGVLDVGLLDVGVFDVLRDELVAGVEVEMEIVDERDGEIDELVADDVGVADDELPVLLLWTSPVDVGVKSPVADNTSPPVTPPSSVLSCRRRMFTSNQLACATARITANTDSSRRL